MAQTVKNLPEMLETQVRSLGWEDPLEKGTATHSTILAWRIPWTEEAGGPQSMGSYRVGRDWATNAFTFSCLFYSVFQMPDYPETRVGWELPFLQYEFMCKLNIYQAPTKCQELCQSAENLVIKKAGEVLLGPKDTNKTLRSFTVMGSGERKH